jgi:hypothetical protein
MPDLDIVTDGGVRRVFSLLHEARPVLVDFDGRLDIAPWSDRIRYVAGRYSGQMELPVLGAGESVTAALIRPEGYVAWVGEGTDQGLTDALTRWFGAGAR